LKPLSSPQTTKEKIQGKPPVLKNPNSMATVWLKKPLFIAEKRHRFYGVVAY
jgi:hypothetical protein